MSIFQHLLANIFSKIYIFLNILAMTSNNLAKLTRQTIVDKILNVLGGMI